MDWINKKKSKTDSDFPLCWFMKAHHLTRAKHRFWGQLFPWLTGMCRVIVKHSNQTIGQLFLKPCTAHSHFLIEGRSEGRAETDWFLQTLSPWPQWWRQQEPDSSIWQQLLFLGRISGNTYVGFGNGNKRKRPFQGTGVYENGIV